MFAGRTKELEQLTRGRSASTVLNGSLTDESTWRRRVDQIIKHVTAPAAKRTAAR